jgi:dipeptidyl-peptidase 4
MSNIKLRTPCIFWLLLVTLVCLHVGVAQQRSKEFTLEDIFSGKFSSKSVRGFQWIEGGEAYSYLETDTAKKQTDLWSYDVSTGKKKKIVDAAKLVLKEGDKPFAIQNYFWSPDEKQLLFTGSLMARSQKTGGNFYLYDLRMEAFKQLTETDQEQMNAKFSQDGSMIGFVRANNIFVLNLSDGKETQLTFDGAEHVLNGRFDWVYEEEFSIIDGWQWSPDSKSIAYWQLDENRVPEFPIMDFLPLHQEVKKMRYPKAGDPNSMVRIGVVNLETKKTIWMDIGAPFDSTQDLYIPRMQWTNKPNMLLIQRLNRQQNQLDVMLVDGTSGKAKIILTETDNTWVDVKSGALSCLEKSDQFIWSSRRDGYRHLYLYDLEGKLIRQLTQGEWEVERFAGVDEKNGTVYFIAGVTSPLERDLYSVKLDGSGFKRITKGSGTHGANFTPDYSVFLETFSDVNTPTKTSLRKNDGSLICVIEEGTINALADYTLSPKTFFKFKTSDGIELNGSMIKPFDFDPQKKYPVLIDVYGGPGSQTVRNSWGGSNFLWYQLLAQKGYIIVSVDNRGTGARGKEFESITYKHLGKWETHDQIEGAKYLATLPYVDASRIGIWGWSYGGYMTLMAMFLGADVFKTGVAVAPGTDWKYYDTIYSERYMLTPKENPDGYEESAPVNHVKDLKGNLLIIHGTADDNVHWQNTVALVSALIKEGKQFETAFYPGGMHGIAYGKARVQLYTKITNFILEKL